MSEMSEKKESVLSVDLLKHDGGTLTFTKLADYKDWLKKQVDAWGWLGAESFVGALTEQEKSDARKVLRAVVLPFEEALKAKPVTRSFGQPAAFSFDVSKKRLTASKRRLLVEGSETFDFVMALVSADPVLAMYSVGFFIGLSDALGDGVKKAEAISISAKFVLGETHEDLLNIPGYLADLQAAAGKIQSMNKSAAQTLREVREQCGGIVVKVEKEISQWRSERFTALEEEIGSIIRKTQDDVGALKQAYVADVALKAPVQYWTETAAGFRQRAKYALSATIGLVVVFFLGMLLVGSGVVPVFGSELAVTGWVDYWRLAPAALLTFMFVWFVRVGLRSYFSAQHLAVDSEIRANLTKSYLALLSTEHVIGDAGTFRLLLDALFRPTTTGLAGGEQPPPTPQTIIQQVLDTQKM